MRLVCPNCEAKYEVPEDAIPETGRDVQCANCGHAWYQMRARAATAEAATPPTAPVATPVAAPVAAAVEPPAPDADPVAVVEPEPEPVPTAEVAEAAVPDPSALDAPVDDAPAPDAPALGDPAPDSAAMVDETVVEPVQTASEAVSAALDEAKAVMDAAPEPVAETVAAVADAADPSLEAVADAAVEAVAESVDLTPVAEVVEAVAEPAAAEATTSAPVDVKADVGDPVAAPLAAAASAAVPAAYAVDDSVLAILREEAEREALARRAEAAKPLEIQPDLGIDAAIPGRKAVEVLSTDDPVAVAAEDSEDKLSARRTRLPDVEEIKSTLRPSEQSMEDADTGPMPVPVEGRSSFRSGFLLVMTVAILGMALYSSADALASAVPALEGILKAYVGFVDSLRLQLDGLMQSATVAINGA
jgi:predicted Zn finger-like uncharacterized protein